VYNKRAFVRKLDQMENFHDIIPASLVLDKLGDSFTYDELKKCVEEAKRTSSRSIVEEMYLTRSSGWHHRITK